MEDDEVTLTMQQSRGFGRVVFDVLLAIVLPSMTPACRIVGEPDDETSEGTNLDVGPKTLPPEVVAD